MAKKAKIKDSEETESTRTDGRKAMLVYMKPELKNAVKDAAKKADQKAWQFVEAAVKRALKWKDK